MDPPSLMHAVLMPLCSWRTWILPMDAPHVVWALRALPRKAFAGRVSRLCVPAEKQIRAVL